MKPRIPRNAVSLALAGICLAVGAGCSSIRKLPPVKAEEIHSTTSFMGFKTTADAYGVSHTPATLKAADAKFTLSWPGFYHETSAKGYEQRVKQEDKP